MLTVQVLVKGKWYDRRKSLVLFGWTEGNGSGADGYCIDDYFNDGVYLGPDECGIEPIFE